MQRATLIIRIGRRERSRRQVLVDDLVALVECIAPHIPLIIEQERAPVTVLVELPSGVTLIIGRYPQGTVFVGGGEAA